MEGLVSDTNFHYKSGNGVVMLTALPLLLEIMGDMKPEGFAARSVHTGLNMAGGKQYLNTLMWSLCTA